MTKNEKLTRKINILAFIYRVKIIQIQQIAEMFFSGSYDNAKKYVQMLEKGKTIKKNGIFVPAERYLKGYYFQTGLLREKIYRLTGQGINFLKEKGIDAADYNINFRELAHDIAVIDILIWFLKYHKGIIEYKTDYILRRERVKEVNTTIVKAEEKAKSEGKKLNDSFIHRIRRGYRIPDFIFVDGAGVNLVEYQTGAKNTKTIKDWIYDYKNEYKGYARIYFVVPSWIKAQVYFNRLSKENLERYAIYVYKREQGGLKLVKDLYDKKLKKI